MRKKDIKGFVDFRKSLLSLCFAALAGLLFSRGEANFDGDAS